MWTWLIVATSTIQFRILFRYTVFAKITKDYVVQCSVTEQLINYFKTYYRILRTGQKKSESEQRNVWHAIALIIFQLYSILSCEVATMVTNMEVGCGCMRGSAILSPTKISTVWNNQFKHIWSRPLKCCCNFNHSNRNLQIWISRLPLIHLLQHKL